MNRIRGSQARDDYSILPGGGDAYTAVRSAMHSLHEFFKDGAKSAEHVSDHLTKSAKIYGDAEDGILDSAPGA